MLINSKKHLIPISNDFIQKIKLAPKSYEFTHPMKIGSHLLNERKILELTFTWKSSHTSKGIISPLEGLSLETLDQVENQLRNIADTLTNQPLKWEQFDLTKPLFNLFEVTHIVFYPSLIFALEEAILDYLHSVNNYLVSFQTKTNFLYVPGNDSPIDVCQKLNSLDRTCLKIKLGRLKPENEFRDLKILAKNLSPSVTLRGDGNQSLNFEYFEELLNIFPLERFEYFEEPFKPTKEILQKFQTHFNCLLPVALDESLNIGQIDDPFNTTQCNQFMRFSKIEAIIYKPQLWGGISGALRMLEYCKSLNKKLVISSLFESLNPYWPHHYLATISDSYCPTFHGLETAHFLKVKASS